MRREESCALLEALHWLPRDGRPVLRPRGTSCPFQFFLHPPWSKRRHFDQGVFLFFLVWAKKHPFLALLLPLLSAPSPLSRSFSASLPEHHWRHPPPHCSIATTPLHHWPPSMPPATKKELEPLVLRLPYSSFPLLLMSTASLRSPPPSASHQQPSNNTTTTTHMQPYTFPPLISLKLNM